MGYVHADEHINSDEHPNRIDSYLHLYQYANTDADPHVDEYTYENPNYNLVGD